MLHRAIFGSYETLYRHPDRTFRRAHCPCGLAPVQAVGGAPLCRNADGYADDVAAKLKAAGIRVETDVRNEKINYKVRETFSGESPAPAGGGQARGRGRARSRSARSAQNTRKVMSLADAIAMLRQRGDTARS